jgi:hypothetical protein
MNAGTVGRLAQAPGWPDAARRLSQAPYNPLNR